MNSFLTFQSILELALGVLALGLQGFALLDALRQRKDAFTATGNQTKPIWLAILGVAVVIGLVSVFNPLNIFSLLAVIAAGVYLTRVRPPIRAITGNGPTNQW